MWGRSKPVQPRPNAGFGGFIFKNAVLLIISFIIAFYFAAQVVQYAGFVLVPIGSLLGTLVPQANDPFWLSYILIYGLLQLFVMFFRYKTGSRI